APGLLVGAYDVDGDSPLTARIGSTPPANGTVVINGDGSFSYTPNPGFHGTDTFTFEVHDGQGGFAEASVTITVLEVNDAPVANADTYTVDEDGTLTVGAPGVLGNDTDAD